MTKEPPLANCSKQYDNIFEEETQLRINWKVRARNPQFWLQIALAIVVPVGGYFGITGADVTTWLALWGVIIDAVSNPYVLFIIGVSLYNSVLDPTTRGLSDSRQALSYDEPRKDGGL